MHKCCENIYKGMRMSIHLEDLEQCSIGSCIYHDNNKLCGCSMYADEPQELKMCILSSFRHYQNLTLKVKIK